MNEAGISPSLCLAGLDFALADVIRPKLQRERTFLEVCVGLDTGTNLIGWGLNQAFHHLYGDY